MEKIGQIYDFLIKNQLFTEGELSLLCCINGYSVDTLNSAIIDTNTAEKTMSENNI